MDNQNNTTTSSKHLNGKLSTKGSLILIFISLILFGIEFKLLTLMDEKMDKNYTSSSSSLYYQLNPPQNKTTKITSIPSITKTISKQ